MRAASLRCRDGPHDQRRELLGGVDGRVAPSLDNRPSDPPRKRFLAVAAEQCRQFTCLHGGQQVCGGTASARVEAHVQASAGAEPEAPLHVRQLVARQPQVKE